MAAATTDAATVSVRLTRAIELGRRLAAIRDEPDLWRLSRTAWVRGAAELAGLSSLAEIKALRDRLAGLPNLMHELRTRARLWADHGQDRPGVWELDGNRFPVAYVELLHSGVTMAQASAVICLLTAELRDETEGYTWGRADSLDRDTGDAAKAMAPHRAELVTLDKHLAGTLLASQLTYRAGKAVVEHAGIVVELDAGNVRHLATAFAEAAGLRAGPAEVAEAA